MLINEIFYSLQGEGPWVGLPAIFIRLGGCVEPMCPWCDTKYALNEYTDMACSDIIKQVKTSSCINIIITGGEPFLQWKSGLAELHDKLLELGYHLQYETSGKVPVPDLKNAAIVCSPKYIEGMWYFDRSNLSKIDVFKFVAQEETFEAITNFITENQIKKEQVYIMPIGATKKEQVKNMKSVFNFCKDQGYRMTPRLHILIFDGKRGV
ncbi:MAG: 7-carboxy-7-deazaguanine synthase QueE [Thermodesulfobacteriota bacterium]|nr:7-carboxy-7-deazaguanine synthase QueE [Thermodesulfobacteriota bacterium]